MAKLTCSKNQRDLKEQSRKIKFEIEACLIFFYFPKMVKIVSEFYKEKKEQILFQVQALKMLNKQKKLPILG